MSRNVRRLLTASYAAALSVSAHAQSYRDVAPQTPPSMIKREASPPQAVEMPQATQVAVPSLAALIFVPAGTSDTSAPQAQIGAEGLPVLDAAFLQTFQPDIGKPLTFERLAQIRRAVVAQYRAAGKPLVDVFVPEQDVTNGVVHIAIAEFRLGQVRASGNRYFSDAVLTSEMPLRPGEPILQSQVAAGLAMLNANPYRSVDVVYAPGTAANSTDVLLQTDDRLPLRVNAGYDNAGVPQLGRDRFLAGIDYGNLFGLDQQIAYQFTASNDIFGGNPDIEGRPDRARFMAHSLSYSAPLPWHDRIELFGVYAQSTPRLPDSYGQTGISAQASIRYDWLLPPAGDWNQQMQFGYDFKRTNNDLEFGGFQVFNSNVHVHQFLASYSISQPDDFGLARANVTLVASPGGLDSDNSDTAFTTARQGATARYAYLQLGGQHDFALGAGFAFSARGTFQWTPNTLLPSEELGLGGETSVRGYDPYVVLGDRGWNVQTEVRTPGIPIGASSIAMQPFVFLDAGHAWNRIDQPAEASNGSLVSVGAGLRVQWSRHVDLRGTYGVPLRAPVPGGSKAPMVQLFVSIGT